MQKRKCQTFQTSENEDITKEINKLYQDVSKIISQLDINKFNSLGKTLDSKYEPLIKKLAYAESIDEKQSFVTVLFDLGNFKKQLGLFGLKNLNKRNNNHNKLRRDPFMFFTEAAVLYMYVISIISRDLNHENKDTADKLNESKNAINDLEKRFFPDNIVQSESDSTENTENTDKDPLKSLRQFREDIVKKVNELNLNVSQEDSKCVQNLYEKIAEKMKKILSSVYKHCEYKMVNENNKKPYKYAVIGLGSMALKQMTPYSDFEFAILTEKCGNKNSRDLEKYLRKLTHLVNFQIIKLGETVIPTSKYNIDMSHLINVGVNFDLGGKTPLGREDKNYSLIKTIDKMLDYVRNKNNKSSQIDKTLPYILEHVCYVYGDKELVKEYQKKVQEFLNEVDKNDLNRKRGENDFIKNRKIRAIKVLNEVAVEFNYLDSQDCGEIVKKKSFQSDLGKQTILENQGKVFNVKLEIYRLPDRLLYNLGMFYGMDKSDYSCWDIIDHLKDKKMINDVAADNLKLALNFATVLRLKIYFFYKAQNNKMSSLFKSEKSKIEFDNHSKPIFQLTEEERKNLFNYYYVSLPLHEILEKLCEKFMDGDQTDEFLKVTKFYKEDSCNEGFINYRIGKYPVAKEKFEVALKAKEFKKNKKTEVDSQADDSNKKHLQKFLQARLTLGKIYISYGNGDNALKQFKKCLKHSFHCVFENKIQFDNFLCQEEDIENFFKQFNEEKLKKYFKDKVNKLEQKTLQFATHLYSLGKVCHLKDKHIWAIKCYEISMKFRKIFYEDELHHDIVKNKILLGQAYLDKSLLEQVSFKKESDRNMAKKFFDKAYEDLDQIDKEKTSINRAYLYRNYGSYYETSDTKLKKDRDKANLEALKYYVCDLKIKQLYYINDPDIIDCYNNIGNVYYNLGRYDIAFYFDQECIKMQLETNGDIYNLDTAASYNNLGSCYLTLGELDLAEKFAYISIGIKDKLEFSKDSKEYKDNMGLLDKIIFGKSNYVIKNLSDILDLNLPKQEKFLVVYF